MRNSRALVGFIAILAAAWHVNPARGDENAQAARIEFFERKVRPIFVQHCHACHSAETRPAGGLRVDDRNGLLVGGSSGPAIVPGSPDASLLLRRITHKEEKRRMPLEGKQLTESQVADIKTWIQSGAAWPAVKLPASIGKLRPEQEQLKKTHWAWQPLRDPKPPEVKDTAWARDEIDRFILFELESRQLKPVRDADRSTLLRRVTFDLTGLPPTPQEIESFLADESADAYARVVDSLLASPRFGERWGRHWLDVARYGESTGPSRNIPYPHAWKYRDYVIAALNADVPYHRFIQEQVAGDLLPASTPAERDRLATATGFLALGVKDVNQRFKVRFVMDNVDEQIDAVTRSVLALTVSCARCHDHKFDPIPQTDYYALAGIFTSTDNAAGVRNKMGGGGLDYYDPSMLIPLKSDLPPVSPEKLEKLKAELAEAKQAWDAIRGTPAGLKTAANGQPTQRPFRLRFEKLQADLLALSDPASGGHAVHGVRDASRVGDTEVRIRGEAEKLGPQVPRGFLSVYVVPGAGPIDTSKSGRLELARWLTSPDNSLAQRVIVNRAWKSLFGNGIVSTEDNFGVNGDAPSHPALLDYLAQRFLREGSSIKSLLRSIALSRTYQLSAEASVTHRQADPGNRLLWRHTPRRLEAEEIRDAILASGGNLSSSRPQGSAARELKMVEMRDDGPEAAAIHQAADRSTARSIYLPLLRGVTPRALEAFDPVEQSLVSGGRDATTVPGQALFLLNAAFVRKQAESLAEQLVKSCSTSSSLAISTAYRRILGRSPTSDEVRRGSKFLAEYEAAYLDILNTKLAGAPAADQLKNPIEPRLDSNPVDQAVEAVPAKAVQHQEAKVASWIAFVQALFGSAEFRYVS